MEISLKVQRLSRAGSGAAGHIWGGAGWRLALINLPASVSGHGPNSTGLLAALVSLGPQCHHLARLQSVCLNCRLLRHRHPRIVKLHHFIMGTVDDACNDIWRPLPCLCWEFGRNVQDKPLQLLKTPRSDSQCSNRFRSTPS